MAPIDLDALPPQRSQTQASRVGSPSVEPQHIETFRCEGANYASVREGMKGRSVSEFLQTASEHIRAPFKTILESQSGPPGQDSERSVCSQRTESSAEENEERSSALNPPTPPPPTADDQPARAGIFSRLMDWGRSAVQSVRDTIGAFASSGGGLISSVWEYLDDLVNPPDEEPEGMAEEDEEWSEEDCCEPDTDAREGDSFREPELFVQETMENDEYSLEPDLNPSMALDPRDLFSPDTPEERAAALTYFIGEIVEARLKQIEEEKRKQEELARQTCENPEAKEVVEEVLAYCPQAAGTEAVARAKHVLPTIGADILPSEIIEAVLREIARRVPASNDDQHRV